MVSSFLTAKKSRDTGENAYEAEYRQMLKDDRERKVKLKNQKMAARANYRVKKWMADNAENDAIAQSK